MIIVQLLKNNGKPLFRDDTIGFIDDATFAKFGMQSDVKVRASDGGGDWTYSGRKFKVLEA